MASSGPSVRLAVLRGQLRGGVAAAHAPDFDAIVVGAGFSGMLTMHKFRQLGMSVCVLEQAGGVGGTWYWNAYPGARCDVPSVEYSYSNDAFLGVQQEWEWTECMAAQPEIERYANFVADRFDLRRDIKFNTRVTGMDFDDTRECWTVTTSDGATRTARFVVAATGCLSAPSRPALHEEARCVFHGPVYLTGTWPRSQPDLTGLRVAVVGTGSSAIQAIPVIAESAKSLTVFQRTPQYTVPANNHPLDKDYAKRARENYGRIRAAERESFAGMALVPHLGEAMRDPGEDELPATSPGVSVLDMTPEERAERVKRLGFDAVRNLSDVRSDMRANELAREMFREELLRVVKDRATAEALVPTDIPLGCKRQVIDTNYYETFNRPNVRLVDLRRGGITGVTPDGLRTADGERHDVDVIVFATGFDALSGPLLSCNVTGRGGLRLADKWRAGPVTYLGLQIAGFPNLFTVCGPGSPSVLSNMMVSLEQHVEWITECVRQMRASGKRTIEPTEEAEAAWVAECNAQSSDGPIGKMLTHPTCNSWYLGANIPGKPRVFMPYAGGVGTYRKMCDEVTAAGYRGFAMR